MVNEFSLTRICPDIIAPRLEFRPSRWANMLVKHAYIIDPSCGKFNRRLLSPSDPLCYRVNQCFDLLVLCQTQKTPFFQSFKCPHRGLHANSFAWLILTLSASSFNSILGGPLPEGTPIIPLKTKWFCASQPPEFSTLPGLYPRFNHQDWSHFWDMSLSHCAHIIFWCLYHRKLPCKNFLIHLVFTVVALIQKNISSGLVLSEKKFGKQSSIDF